MSKPPAILKVPLPRTRAGPPKSGFRGFEELSAVHSRTVAGGCKSGIDAEKLDGAGTASHLESVGNAWPRRAAEV